MRKDKMHLIETLEKSKGKHSRRLRDYAEKLARVPREEARPKQKTQTDSTTIRLSPGGCSTLVCGPDTACYPYNDNTQHLCICTTTGEPPTVGQKCPRSKVHTVTEKLLPGGCAPLVCRGETACIPHTSNTQHECLCTTTGEPPTEDMKCPRSTVSPTFRHRDKPTKVIQASTDSPERLTSSEPYLGKFLPGGCGPLSCEKEMACMPYNNNTQHLCLCTTNGQPPNEDLKCPRSTVPLTPKPIHNIILPRTSNTSTDSKYSLSQFTGPNSQGSDEIQAEAAAGSDSLATNSVKTSSAVWATITIGGLLSAAILITIIVVLYLRKRVRRTDCKAQPRIRPGEPLLAERYITNPQYGVCGASALALSIPGSPGGPHGDEGPTVPLLHRNALTFLEEVGEGCFGKVHKGLLRSNDGESVVAIKVLKESANRSAEEDFEREVSIMSAFRHPNILALIGVVNRGDIGASPWMVFEYMEWGDLAGVLRGVRGGGRPGPILDDSALLHVALQVARGMQYLASRRFVHRDLAARNCLVGSQLTVKIADFGMSRDVYTCDYYKMGGERPMPVRWMSPESIIYARFTHESDVWSYGVVLWEIYSRGKQPFYGHNNNAVTKIILQGILLVPPENCPRFACELMRECWKSDPRDRIGFDDLCLKLEAAHAAGDAVTQMRLPRPPPLPQDSAGYLVPAIGPPVDYVVPLPEPDLSDDGEEDYDYT